MGLALLLISAVLRGGDAGVSIAAAPSTPAARPDFRTESDLVLIPVSVTDSKNHAVTGLDRGAFRVFEDKTEQTVVQFAREDAPISVGIVFDSSGSMTGKLTKSREAIQQFLRFANPEDEFFLVEVGSPARLTVPFTADPATLQNRLLMAQPKGTTALLDGVCLGMQILGRARYPRRALVILSDGGDNHSRYTESEIRDRIRESDLWIYAMGIYDRNPAASPREIAGGRKLLESLAGESGGRHFAVTSLVDLPVAAARISLELRNRYVLGYRPSSPRSDGKYHRVRVSVAGDRYLNVSFRPGYYGTID